MLRRRVNFVADFLAVRHQLDKHCGTGTTRDLAKADRPRSSRSAENIAVVAKMSKKEARNNDQTKGHTIGH